MKLLGNIIWLLFGGFFGALAFLILGFLWCISIIGIPFGLQAFKIANLTLVPFGSNVTTHFEKHPIGNIIWIFLGGFALTLFFLFVGIFFCISIIGIPFGLQFFKLAKLAFSPMGATITN